MIYLNGRAKDKFDGGGKDGLFSDTRVRLALNHAINRDALIKKIFHGYALANASPWPPCPMGMPPRSPTRTI